MLQYGTRCQFDCFKWDETIREAVMKSMQGTPYHVEALRRNEEMIHGVTGEGADW